jgi:hypothetical protein
MKFEEEILHFLLMIIVLQRSWPVLTRKSPQLKDLRYVIIVKYMWLTFGMEWMHDFEFWVDL